jgi:large subunit ribosomal protein L2
MAIIAYKPTTHGRRFSTTLVHSKTTGVKGPRKLKNILKKNSGRDSSGKVTVRGQGGRHKRYYRGVDFKRENFGIEGEVVNLEYDPNRNVEVALVKYGNGQFRYILAPKGLSVGSMVKSAEKTELKAGNAMMLKNIPIGTIVHNIELTPGKGGQIGRSAGVGIQVLAKEGGFVHLKMPSGEVRMVRELAMASVGQLGNEEWKNMSFGKAGRKRWMGIRPTNRGVAQDPDSHPHGGGEGRSGVGRKKPMTVYGRPAVGKTRNKKKWTSKYIVKRRNK